MRAGQVSWGVRPLPPAVGWPWLGQLAAWSAWREVGAQKTADLEIYFVTHLSTERGRGSSDRSRRNSHPAVS
jgi:hypothetical protein